ncbi:MAG: serine hydroxymethyltransferase [Patescibacteria group bacterium]
MEKEEIFNLIEQETNRQKNGLVMIASENYASKDVLSAMGTALSNKYSEGYPGKRYYTGNQFIDEIETAAQKLALKIFGLNEEAWRANVQPHSGSSANLAVYLGLLQPGERIMGLDLATGGHLTHGSPVNFSGKLFNFVHYGVNPETGRLDYNEIEKLAIQEQPKMIVCGFTAYSRTIDFQKFSEIAKKIGAWLLADISHVAGLIVGGVHPSPFPYADIVTTTTHKTLRGPRGAIIICKKELGPKIDKAIFPGLQGGPLENVIAAKALCFNEALSDKFKQDQIQTVKNCRALCQTLIENGLKIVSGGTDNHLLLVDCRPLEISGKDGALALAEAEIYTNANMIPFDPATPLNPSGIRLGVAALTTRGMKENEMKIIGNWISQILKDHANLDLKSRIKKEVLELTSNFPIY